MLQFDSKTARFLDDAYQGSDLTRRRLANLAALAPRPGDTILDIGCGTGLPAVLSPMLRDAGFAVEAIEPVIIQDTVFRADGLARMMMHLISAYVRQNGLAERETIDGWVAEQNRMAEEGRFFFAVTHFIVSAAKV